MGIHRRIDPPPAPAAPSPAHVPDDVEMLSASDSGSSPSKSSAPTHLCADSPPRRATEGLDGMLSAPADSAPGPAAAPRPARLGRPARDKQTLGADDRAQLRAALERQGALPAGKFSPSVMILEDGRRLYLSNRLEHGGFGKYRLGVMQGRLWGVKELRTPDQSAYQRDPARPRTTAVTSWQVAEGEIALLRQRFTDMRIFEVISHRGRLYLLMEPMHNNLSTVGARMQAAGLAPGVRLNVALSMLKDASASLARTHRAAWVHRDIKPDNLFVAADGRVRVGDVGLATALANGARLGELVGTGAFIAPELWHGAPGSTAADIWSLGMSFVSVLTGVHPLDLPMLTTLSFPERAAVFRAVAALLPRRPGGGLDVNRLRLGSEHGLEGYLAELNATFGSQVTGAVFDRMLNIDASARPSAWELGAWAESQLRRLAATDVARAQLQALAAPDREVEAQAFGLRLLASAGDG